MTILQYIRGVLVILVAFLLFFTIVSESRSRSLVKPDNIPQEINSLLSNIEVGSPINYDNMTVYPLILKNADSQHFTFLDEAIKSGIIEIKEIGSGNVNSLELIKNSSNLPAYIMSGEIVKGAKQDRVISNDLVFGKESGKYTIPVYCVEQGRWVNKSEKFDAAKLVASQKLRKTVSQKVSQSAVWSEVSKKNQALGASTQTSNYRDSYESKEFKENASKYIAHYLSLPEKNPNYLGAIIQIDNKLTNTTIHDNKFTNIDIFNNNETFKTMWPMLLKAYAQDAVDSNITFSLPEFSSAHDFLNSINKSNFSEMANPGLGVEYKISSQKTAGNVLIFNNTVIHLALFTESTDKIQPHNSNNGPSSNNIQQIQNIPNIVSPRKQRHY